MSGAPCVPDRHSSEVGPEGHGELPSLTGCLAGPLKAYAIPFHAPILQSVPSPVPQPAFAVGASPAAAHALHFIGPHEVACDRLKGGDTSSSGPGKLSSLLLRHSLLLPSAGVALFCDLDRKLAASGNPGNGPSAGSGVARVFCVVFLVAAVHDQEGQADVGHYDLKPCAPEGGGRVVGAKSSLDPYLPLNLHGAQILEESLHEGRRGGGSRCQELKVPRRSEFCRGWRLLFVTREQALHEPGEDPRSLAPAIGVVHDVLRP